MENQEYVPKKDLPHRGTPSGKASELYRVELSHDDLVLWICSIIQPGAENDRAVCYFFLFTP